LPRADRSCRRCATACWLFLGKRQELRRKVAHHAWRCIGEATTLIETSKESWYEAEVHRIAGEIVLLSPAPDAPKAECAEGGSLFRVRLRSRVASRRSPGNCARR
jgi:hypothetical protein